MRNSPSEWNAFSDAKAEDVKHQEGLGELCMDEITFLDSTIFCRQVHAQGALVHEALLADDSGMRTLRITWK